MSEIKKGDLVMVVSLMPCGHGSLGYTFIAHGVTQTYDNCGLVQCARCKKTYKASLVAHVDAECSHTDCVAIHRLKKIDPPATGDEVSTRVVRRTPEKHEA